jgi:hypothetical protein
MAHSFKYAILQAVPDARRGERANIGVVAFAKDGLDVRVLATRKLSALTARSWDTDIKGFVEIIKALDDPKLPPHERVQQLHSIEGTFSLSQAGWFEAVNEQEFESAMREIAKTLVARPRRARRVDGSSVVSEISAELRKAKVLASREDSIESGLVFRGYNVGNGLQADFAQQNSQFHVAAVLDLRANNPQLAQAALKSIVLDQAEERFENVHKVGVYSAAKERLPELHDNLAILKPYADDVYNWEDEHDRTHLTRMFYDAYAAHHGLGRFFQPTD